MEKFSERQRCVGSVTGPSGPVLRWYWRGFNLSSTTFQNDPFAIWPADTSVSCRAMASLFTCGGCRELCADTCSSRSETARGGAGYQPPS